jgi:hypothetical protein
MVFDIEEVAIIGTERYAEFQRTCARAGDLEVYYAKKKGLPITGVEGTDIVTRYADGRVEIIGAIPPPFYPKKLVYDLTGITPEMWEKNGSREN